MKLKLDLLPNERKKVKQDNRALIACLVLLLITFIWYIPVKNHYSGKVEVKLKEISEIAQKIKVKQSENSNISGIISSPLNIPSDISYLISFLEEASYSWYRFFDSIEDSANSRIWISEIKKNNINDFYLIGEASDNYFLSDFYHNLMKKANFSKVFLLSSEKIFNKEIEKDIYLFKIHVVLKEETL